MTTTLTHDAFDPRPPAATPARRVFIRSWGCQMNVYDSGRMADALAPLGYAPAATQDDADLVILNTCHIREKASDKLYSELGRLREAKRARQAAGSPLLIAVAGCVAQAEGAEIAARAPWVDCILGPQSTHRLPELIARAHRATGTQLETDFPRESKFDHLPEATGPAGVAAFLTVQEGCDKFCSFCVVPYTRGAEYARPVAAVLAEARSLVARGAREITLLGQNVNAYRGEGPGGGTWDLARLLAALAAVPGLLRLRYTTSHPRDMSAALIEAHRDIPMLMPWLHLPVQSGSDRVLAAMHRGHTVADFRATVDRLRAARPDLALSSDFIVGHPGETAADFDATLALVRELGFAGAFSFAYSPRPGTPAASAPSQVPVAERVARLAVLQAVLREQAAAFNRSRVGMTIPILLTGPGRHPGQLAGRSPWLQPVHLAGPPALVGTEQQATILAAHPNSLAGRLAGAFPHPAHPSAEESAAA